MNLINITDLQPDIMPLSGPSEHLISCFDLTIDFATCELLCEPDQKALIKLLEIPLAKFPNICAQEIVKLYDEFGMLKARRRNPTWLWEMGLTELKSNSYVENNVFVTFDTLKNDEVEQIFLKEFSCIDPILNVTPDFIALYQEFFDHLLESSFVIKRKDDLTMEIIENNLKPMIEKNWNPENEEFGNLYLCLQNEDMTYETSLFRDNRSLSESTQPYTLQTGLIDVDSDGSTEVTEIIYEVHLSPEDLINLTEDEIITLAERYEP